MSQSMKNETARNRFPFFSRGSGLRPTLIAVFLLSPALGAQAPPATDVKQVYAKLCGGCHGVDALGTQQGPGLAGNPWMRRRSNQSLRRIIRNGIPAAGMPGFDLPEATLDALVTLIASLNASAAETSVPGDRTAGKAFFFGKGQCASCHMVYGEGAPIGPDLSNVAREMTVEEIRQSLLRPDVRIAPGYGLVSVHLRNGQTLRGFARTRTRYDLALQDLEGVVHPLSLDRVSRITDEKQSLMQPVKAGAAELRDLIAFLSRLTGVQAGVLVSRASKSGIDFQRILNPRPGDWLTYNGKLSGNRYSELAQINAANVGKLGLKWTFSIPLWSQFLPDTPYYRENMRYFGLETVPIVADGIMYVTGPNQAFALDARTGHQIWHYSRPRTPGLVSDASLGTNRGVAIRGENVFMVTDNAHLIALNRVTGRLVWEVVMPDEPQRYGSTVAPLVVKNMVIAGVSGGDWGIRGFLAAYDAGTGERVWRHWTVPAKGDPGFDTWKGNAVTYGGGATWLTGSYDPDTDTLYWATGNPWPDSDDRERGGDNLFTNCVLALDPATGKLKWYYQFTPHDVHDWDATEPNVLVDAKYRGQDRKLLLHADRNGFFYVFDRTDGRLLLAEKFMRRLTWASGIGPDGRPVRVPERDISCPDHATNWNGTAFSPATRLYYVMATEKCSVKLSPGSWKTGRPPEEPGKKYLRALDIETGKIVWEVPQVGPADGKRVAGLLGTAGGLLFYGDPSGYFVAADERDGRTLWRVPLNATIKTSPMTFAIGGQQFVALAVGSNIMCFGLTQ
ncbi:MAG: PQQ-binding-like beta-propeller repeat protein [Acidobacteria bacterium]|nr:PQQ-binding-like beta-propeller repeat protein [Acidobacteriota bacterium]